MRQVFTLLVLACASSSFMSPRSAHAVARTPAAFQDVQVVRSGVEERVQRLLDTWVASDGVPGLTAGVATADGAFAFAAGRRTRGDAPPMSPTDLMCAGSTGKTFVAALVCRLVEEERLALAAPVAPFFEDSAWFARVPNATSLRVEHLLTHTSGLERYELDPEFHRDLIGQRDRVWTVEQRLAYVLDDAPLFAPGEGFAYSDTNYVLLGAIVERVTGARLEDEITRRFLVPLELTHVRPQSGRVIEGLVQGHAGPNDPLGFPDLVIDDEGRYFSNPQFEWAGGGWATSAGDLARWGHALYAGDVLTAESRQRTLTGRPARELGPRTEYGLGAIVRTSRRGRAVGHEGFFPGYTSALVHFEEHHTTVALQLGSSEFAKLPGPPWLLCERILEAVLASPADGRSTPERGDH